MGVCKARWHGAHQGWGYLFRLFMALGFLLGAAAPLPADPITATQALAAVQTWLVRTPNPLGARLGSRVAGIQGYSDSSGMPLYFIAALKPKGFVIVSGDDLAEPIIGFFPSGRFDPTPGNPLSALVKRDLPTRLGEIRAQSAAARRQVKSSLSEPRLARARGKWSALLRPAAKASPSFKVSPSFEQINDTLVSDVCVAPLVQTRWDQSDAGGQACYNYYTPPNVAGSAANYPCGCVATAMAQVMRYHQWPTRALGTKYYSFTVDDEVRTDTLRGGDGNGGPYVWSDMVAEPDASTPDAQRRAIGALTADVGAAVKMNYTAAGSGASMQEVRNRFVDLFGYGNAIYSVDNNANVDQDLTASLPAMINPNLDAGCPVLLGILDDWRVLAHAILCDGYGTSGATLYHHVNMGWAGSNDGWYNLPAIGAGHGFSIIVECVYNIFPSGGGEIISGRVTDTLGAPLAGATVTASRTGATTLTLQTNARGIYAFKNLPANTGFAIAAQAAGALLPPPHHVATGQSISNSKTVGNVWGVNFQASAVRIPVVQFTVTASSWPENTGPALVDVTLDIPSTQTLSIDYAVTAGTATAGVDFRPTTGTLQFAPGQTHATVPVELIDDTLYDPDRTVIVTLSHPAAGCYLGLSDSHTLTVRDDELTLADALDHNRLKWLTEGDAPWFPELTVSADGLDAAQSGTIGPGQSSTLYAYVPGPGTLTFQCRLDAQPGDTLSICDNATTVSTITGVTSFTRQTIPIGSGLHLLRWVLTRPANSPAGSSRVWVDQVTWDGVSLPAVPAPSPFYTRANNYAIPARIEAEDFDSGGNGVSFFDTTTGNDGGFYRPEEDVDIADCDDSGQLCVMYIEPNEWLGYTIKVPSTGPYTIQLRVTSPMSGTSCWLDLDGVRLTGTISLPNTGSDWDSFQTVTVEGIVLPAGTHFLRLRTETGGFLINYLQWSSDFAGFLSVSLFPPAAVASGAQWRRVGTELWYASGEVESNVPAGPCQVEFKLATPWEPPVPQAVSIVAKKTTTTSATYTRQAGSLRVTLSPPQVNTDGARWRRVGTTAWLKSGDVETGLAPGSYTVEFNDVASYIKPANIMTTVTDCTAEVTGNYIPWGSLTTTLSPPEAVAQGAMWRRVGTTPWLASDAIETSLTVGQYQIEFKDLADWDEPAIQAVQVAKGQLSHVDASYAYQNGSLKINVYNPSNLVDWNCWRRVGTTTWLKSGDTEQNIPVGTYTVEFLPYAGWVTPTPIQVTIQRNMLATQIRKYFPMEGWLRVNLLPQGAVTEGAAWRRVGMADWLYDGDVDGYVPIGIWEVEFLPIPGWTAPANLITTISYNTLTSLTLAYSRPPGALCVNLAPPEAARDGARWRRAGTTPWLASGMTDNEATSGSHIVEFNTPPGWIAPANGLVQVDAAVTTSIQAVYTRAPGALSVTLSPPQAVSAGARWRRIGTTPWLASGASESNLTSGSYTVEFNTLPGWTAPAVKPLNVFSGTTATLSAAYARPAGALSVTLSPPDALRDGARWRRVGTMPWLVSGAVETNVTSGSNTVEFKTLPGWTAPAVEPVTVLSGSMATLAANYVRPPGALQVTLTPPEAVSAGARWRRVGTTPWLISGSSETNLTSGSYYVEFKTITDWTDPPSKSVTIASGTTATLTAAYTRQPGSLQVTLAPDQAVATGASWRRVGTTVWKKSGDTETGIAPGSFTVEFKTVTGWIAPVSMSVTIKSNQTTQLGRSYQSKSTAIPARDWLHY